MKPSLYVETSVISYLTARLSANLVVAARQRITRAWWETRRDGYDLVVSPIVLEEVSEGDADAAAARLEPLRGIEIVGVSPGTDRLAADLLTTVPLPEKATTDAAHIALAATAGADYLLTWNFKHIANPTLRDRIADVCRSNGYEPSTLCSPEDLLEGTSP